jgi:hypothetical protein
MDEPHSRSRRWISPPLDSASSSGSGGPQEFRRRLWGVGLRSGRPNGVPGAYGRRMCLVQSQGRDDAKSAGAHRHFRRTLALQLDLWYSRARVKRRYVLARETVVARSSPETMNDLVHSTGRRAARTRRLVGAPTPRLIRDRRFPSTTNDDRPGIHLATSQYR